MYMYIWIYIYIYTYIYIYNYKESQQKITNKNNISKIKIITLKLIQDHLFLTKLFLIYFFHS